MSPRLLLRAILCALVGLPACSGSSPTTSLCGTGPNATLTISVVNDSNEAMNVCTAQVVAKGPSTVTLKPGGGSGQSTCDFVGSVSPGSYTVTATATGYMTASIHEDVQAGCDVTGAIQVMAVP